MGNLAEAVAMVRSHYDLGCEDISRSFDRQLSPVAGLHHLQRPWRGG